MSQKIARFEEGDLMANADEIIDVARNEMYALCHGKRWTMSIPVQDTDSDVPLGAVIRLARYAVEQLRAAGVVFGEDAERIRAEIRDGTPDTPQRIETIRRADELFRRTQTAGRASPTEEKA